MQATLASWYDAHPAIRRLWAMEDAQGLRVIVALEPTLDGDDTDPAWIANGPAWTRELRSLTASAIRLERSSASLFEQLDPGLVLIASFTWRDPSGT